jgi:hypothetical protein
VRPVKYYDISLSYSTVNGTPGFLSLCDIPQGLAQSNRVADTIWPVKLDFQILWTAANSDIFCHVRYVIFTWIPNDLSYPVSAPGLFQDYTGAGVLSPINFERRAELKVWRDKFVTLTGTSGAPTVGSAVTHRFSVKLNGRIDYLLASLRGMNHLYFTNFSDSNIPPYPAYVMQCRLWYYDA